MPPVPRRPRQDRNHLIVCGDDALAYRVVEELTTNYGERVTVLRSSAKRGHGPRISRLPGVRVIERLELDSDAFADAQVQSARALALMGQDDLGNFHAALRAQDLNPDLRLVMRIFNTGLGERMRSFFPDCAVLSSSSMAAPSFVAAALGEPTPSHVRLAGRTLFVARRGETDAAHFICGLAANGDPVSPLLLPSGQDSADLVLAVADGTPRNPLTRQPRRPLRAIADLPRLLFGYKLGIVFLTLFAVLVCGFVLLATASGFSPANALYLTFLDAAGAAVTDPRLSAPEKFAQFLLTFDGMAFLPVVTAAVVGARLTGSLRTTERPLSGHVIVAGLGNVGSRIAGQLHDLGVDVVCVDRNENAAGVRLAQRLGLRVVIGETHREETLRAAGIATSQALVSVTDSDIVNLETALHARALAADLRLVLRLSDDDLAERVQKTVGNTISRSVPYLAAPAFAAAMLEHQVLRTVPVGRHVLLIADVGVSAGAELAGQPVESVHRSGEVRVIALRRAAADGVDWSPRPGYLMTPQDRIYVLATRAGLSRLLARSQPPTAELPGPGLGS
ncbi:MAG TPA: NAD-binding protein [Streptosporangiaceae bacterium]|nr:NAD-binding protein [Streptosporangiaceae bacterium]